MMAIVFAVTVIIAHFIGWRSGWKAGYNKRDAEHNYYEHCQSVNNQIEEMKQ